MSDSHGFPWTSRAPTLQQRIVVAVLIGLGAAAIHYFRPGGYRLSDFSVVWYASRSLADGLDPYQLVGPHLQFDLPSPVFYPAPALVAAMPFTLLPVELAGTAFVFVSAAVLAFAVTRESWYLLPLFPSLPFLTSARLGQWSIILTAAVFMPIVAVLSIAKPQASLPAIVSSTKRATWIAAIAGGILLVIVSLMLLPSWPTEWLSLIRTTEYFAPPIASIFGIPIALVLLRWKRPEAWLVFTSACLPQTWYPYNCLILLTVALTYREACGLSLLSSAGWLLTLGFFSGEWRGTQTRTAMQLTMLAVGYLPVLVLILRRPNEGPLPFFFRGCWMGSRK